jgi:hypothetical protein
MSDFLDLEVEELMEPKLLKLVRFKKSEFGLKTRTLSFSRGNLTIL